MNKTCSSFRNTSGLVKASSKIYRFLMAGLFLILFSVITFSTVRANSAIIYKPSRWLEKSSQSPLKSQQMSGNESLDSRVDAIASRILKSTGVPSASVAVVRHGRIVYVHAYGFSKLDPKTKVRPGMRYAIGSISKQFTAASILLLEQEGKLSLDDPISKWLPGLTKAKEVTLRKVLSHTSG